MQKMNKEEFLEILSRQQRSGLTIKDFCINEAYTESSFYYWKGKFGSQDLIIQEGPLQKNSLLST